MSNAFNPNPNYTRLWWVMIVQLMQYIYIYVSLVSVSLRSTMMFIPRACIPEFSFNCDDAAASVRIAFDVISLFVLTTFMKS